MTRLVWEISNLEKHKIITFFSVCNKILNTYSFVPVTNSAEVFGETVTYINKIIARNCFNVSILENIRVQGVQTKGVVKC